MYISLNPFELVHWY